MTISALLSELAQARQDLAVAKAREEAARQEVDAAALREFGATGQKNIVPGGVVNIKVAPKVTIVDEAAAARFAEREGMTDIWKLDTRKMSSALLSRHNTGQRIPKQVAVVEEVTTVEVKRDLRDYLPQAQAA